LATGSTGTQAEYVRAPFADTSLYHVPAAAEQDALLMLSDILPTGFECGVLHGEVQPGSTVAIVGAGPIGLATLLTAQFYSPAEIIMIDLDDNRLEMSSRFGATAAINNKDGKAAERVMKMTGGRGVDTAIEAVGVPASFITCEDTSHRVASSRTWSACGIANRDHDQAGRHRDDADAAEDSAIAQDRRDQTHNLSVQVREDFGSI